MLPNLGIQPTAFGRAADTSVRQLQMINVFYRFFWRCLLLSARRRTVHGIKVGVLLPTVSAEELFSKVAAALDLLRDHGPRQLARMRRLVSSVLVFGAGSVGPHGEWHREVRRILLSEPIVAKSDTLPVHVACLLVHEISHAWLEHRGCEYVSGRRRRIEAICYRAAARLARRIPGGNELGGYYDVQAQQILSQSDDDWSDAAFRNRAVGNLHLLGAPTWLMRFIERFRPGIKRGADSWVERYQQEVASKVWTRALLAWVASEDSLAHPRGPATFLEAVETATGLYALHTVLVTGRTGPLRTPTVAAFGFHSLEVVLMLLRGEGVQPDPEKAAACFLQFMTTGMPPAEAPTFVDEAVTAWNRVRGAAEAGDDNTREWRSNLYTAVSGQLLSGIQDVPNLRATNWNALLNELCTRLLDDFGDPSARSSG